MTAVSRDGYVTPLLFLAVLISSGLLAGYYFLLQGVNEDTTLLFTRYTARVSFAFFLPVFALGALHQLYPSDSSRFLMARRRQLGLAFALAHTVHLGGIVMHYRAIGEWFSSDDSAALVIYLLIGLMAITSNSFSVRKLRGGWKLLHKAGLYGIFVGFFVTYLGRVRGYAESGLEAELKDPFMVYVLLLALISAAWLLRIVAFWQKRA